MRYLELYEDIEFDWKFYDEEFVDDNRVVWAINFYIDDFIEDAMFYISKIKLINNMVEVSIYDDIDKAYKDVILDKFNLSINKEKIKGFINGRKKTIFLTPENDFYYYIKSGDELPTNKQIKDLEKTVARFLINYFNIGEYVDDVYDFIYKKCGLSYLKQ